MQIVFRYEPTNVVAYGEILSPKTRGRVVTETEAAIHSDLLDCFWFGLKWNVHAEILNTNRMGCAATPGGLGREAEAQVVSRGRPEEIGGVNQKGFGTYG